MDRPEWLTDRLLGFMMGFGQAAEIYNAGHLPDWLVKNMLVADGWSAEQAQTAIYYWKWYRAHGGQS